MSKSRDMFLIAVLVGAVISTGSAPLTAQATNLQVLPADMSRGQINAVMRGFTAALGLRCSSCHIGEEGQPLNTYDFASDDNVNKVKAREMLRMMNDINANVMAVLPDRSNGEPMVTCATCHGGMRVPRLIEDVVAAVIEADGLDAAAARYGQLREQYFGGRQYDFSERHLLRMASNMERARDYDAANRFYGLSLQYFEGSVGGHLGLAGVAEAQENLDAARMHYGHVLEIDPENRQALARMEAIGGG